MSGLETDPSIAAVAPARARRADPWDGVMRAREWAMLAISVGTLGVLLTPRQSLLIIAAAAMVFLIAAAPARRNQKMSAAIAVLIAFLAGFQWRGAPSIPHVVFLGIGIAPFFVLRCIDYAVTKQPVAMSDRLSDRIGRFLLYLFFLPTVFAGPVVTFRDLYRSYAPRRANQLRDVPRHLLKIDIGALKFYLVFPFIDRAANALLSGGLTGTVPHHLPASTPSQFLFAGWMVLAFLRIYFAFSGFTDMAIGVSRVLGFGIYENFRFPFLATSPVEFWKRWNISTYRWLMTQVFLPFWDHDNVDAKILTVFLASGLWHIAALQALAWSSVLQVVGAPLVQGCAVIFFLKLIGKPSTASSVEVPHAGQIATLASIAGTFVFTALVNSVLILGLRGQPLHQTAEIFRGLILGHA